MTVNTFYKDKPIIVNIYTPIAAVSKDNTNRKGYIGILFSLYPKLKSINKDNLKLSSLDL